MDNLRSLNSSLPNPSSSRRQRSAHDRQAPQQNQQALLQAFKTAALSVTNLYRAAASDTPSSSYDDGYRDALEDLISFLDAEDIGLADGEGWRVRQYLNDRLASSSVATGHQTGTDGSEDDESGEGDEEKRARSTSPVMQTKTHPQDQQAADATRSTTSSRSESAPPPPPQHQQQSQSQPQSPPLQFTFQAGHGYPAVPHVQDIDMDTSAPHTHRAQRTRQATLRLNNHSHNRAASALAGTKRKLPLGEFFDITGFGIGKDGTSGSGGNGGGIGKRNRLT